jgi:predicted protein tyrosine phosphatase
MRVLFVCRQNKVRSLTAEHLYRVRPDLEVRSAGTATFAKNQLSNELLTWADMIFVFDETQTEAIESRFGPDALQKQVICLDLPDIFEYKSQSLVVKLTAKLEPYLGRPNSKNAPPRKAPVNAMFKPSRSSGQPGRSLVSQLLAAVGVKARKTKIPK